MKILYFIKGLGLGGAERHVVDCAVASHKAGHVVHVAYLLSHKNHLVAELQAAGISVDLIGNNLLYVWRYFSQLRPDIVHAHLPVPAFYSRLYKFVFGYGLVVTHHNMFERQKRLVQVGERLFHRADEIGISCSSDVAASLPWPTRTINNGITIDTGGTPPVPGIRKRFGLGADAIITVCIANLVPKKNHALLCRAFSDARSRMKGSGHCVLIGQDGTERHALRALVKELGCNDCIHFWGADQHAAQLAREADLFCLSSDFEGLPLALLEAMAAGLPAIVTDAGGMSEVVSDGVHGRVVARGACNALADALVELSDNSDLRVKLGQQAKKHVRENYDARDMLATLARIYEDLGVRAIKA
ncbi:MAG: glycosyltransferase [Parerythrobacter sp.]